MHFIKQLTVTILYNETQVNYYRHDSNDPDYTSQ
jgi:hypothetical protein